MKTKSSSGLKVKAGIKTGGLCVQNHTRSGLRVRTGIKAAGGGIYQSNHNARALAVV